MRLRGGASGDLEAGPAATMQSAEAEATMQAAGAEATAITPEVTASPPEAAGCPEVAVRTGAGGAAGPSELVNADSVFLIFATLFVYKCCFSII
jgi:hypothetical protein